MIWAGLAVLAAVVAGLALVFMAQTGVFGSLLGAIDTLHSESKAEALAAEARRELERKGAGRRPDSDAT